jgi:uncharacterized protein YdhG (YjbR/CyaY superfamily)
MTQQNIEILTYINSFESEQVRTKLKALYKLLEELVPPEATQTISYGIPTFKLKGKNFIHFGGAKHHVAIYPGAAAVAKFEPEIAKLKLKTSKGTIQFGLGDDLPASLIKSIVQFLLKSSA